MRAQHSRVGLDGVSSFNLVTTVKIKAYKKV